MTGTRHPLSGSPASVVREIDQELSRLHRYEKAVVHERGLLLSARAALTGEGGAGAARRQRISQDEVAAYLDEHPGSWPAQIAQALQVSPTNVSTHLSRGRHTRYERRDDGWYLRPSAARA
jgi:hypothetical protein